MLPAMALAVAPLLPGLLRRLCVRRYLFGYSVVLMLATGVLGAMLMTEHPWALAQLERRAMPDTLLPVLGDGLLTFAIALATLAVWLRVRRATTLVLLTHGMLWMLYGLVLIPALDPYASASARRVGARIGPDAELALVAWREQNLLQADRPVREFGFKRPWAERHDAGPWLAEAPDKRWLLVLDEAMSPCVDRAKVIDIGMANRNRWQLLPGTACNATPNGPARPPKETLTRAGEIINPARTSVRPFSDMQVTSMAADSNPPSLSMPVRPLDSIAPLATSPLASRFAVTHFWLPVAIGLPVFALLMGFGGDQWVADHLFRLEGSRWVLQDAWITRTVCRRRLRARQRPWSRSCCASTTGVKEAITPCGRRCFMSYPGAGHRRDLLLKSLVPMECPWDCCALAATSHLSGFHRTPAGMAAQACPAGHASAGYAWLCLYYFALLWRPSWRGRAVDRPRRRFGVRHRPAAARCAFRMTSPLH